MLFLLSQLIVNRRKNQFDLYQNHMFLLYKNQTIRENKKVKNKVLSNQRRKKKVKKKKKKEVKLKGY
jgi:hypothetical protein